MAEPYVHHIRPRYGEVDVQHVVFNAHYLAYCDDAADVWFRRLGQAGYDDGWEVVVKKVVITWSSSAQAHDDLAIAVEVSRWGTTSFDVRFTGTVDARPVFEAELTYVAVGIGTKEPIPVPDGFRRLAGG